MTYKKTWYPNLYVQVSLEQNHPYRAKEDEGLLQIVIFHAYTTDIPNIHTHLHSNHAVCYLPQLERYYFLSDTLLP